MIFQKNRFTPIWGGVSLLNCIKDGMTQALHANKSWNFFINLSFADFPIAHREHLRLFLTLNPNRSFCKSHGREPEKFLKKQGLDRVFYECENRMWRLSDRAIPKNLQLDGGSDWFAIDRSTAEYATDKTIDDGTLREVNQFFNFTLLPAESYFHTLLKTSKYCQKMVDNNLRITNWNRARGCKCQYKHIVDWCGCSPNDFTPFDVGKIYANLEKRERDVFFARKFEETVSQYPLNDLFRKVFGQYYPEILHSSSFDSYWEMMYDSEYDYEEMPVKNYRNSDDDKDDIFDYQKVNGIVDASASQTDDLSTNVLKTLKMKYLLAVGD